MSDEPEEITFDPTDSYSQEVAMDASAMALTVKHRDAMLEEMDGLRAARLEMLSSVAIAYAGRLERHLMALESSAPGARALPVYDIDDLAMRAHPVRRRSRRGRWAVSPLKGGTEATVTNLADHRRGGDAA